MFPITNGLKQADALLPLFFNFAVEYAIGGVQVHQEGLELNNTDQFLVYAETLQSLLSSGILYSRLQKVTIPDAVII